MRYELSWIFTMWQWCRIRSLTAAALSGSASQADNKASLANPRGTQQHDVHFALHEAQLGEAVNPFAFDRGLEESQQLAIGDGVLGFWAALHEEYPNCREQRDVIVIRDQEGILSTWACTYPLPEK
jgi:hypothetical protein